MSKKHIKRRKVKGKPQRTAVAVTSRTYQEQLDAALKCKSKEQADIWMSDEIQFYLDNYPGEVTTPEQAATTIMANLGYMAGYYGPEIQQRVYDLFGATHPIFGTPIQPEPTPEEAFKKGVELGEYMRVNGRLPDPLFKLRT